MIDDIMLYVELVNNNCQFNKTSAKLGMSQATLSRKMSNLEQEIGYQIFKRNGNNIEITESGYNLYKNYLGMSNVIKERNLNLVNKSDDYTIRIMTGHTTYQLVLKIVDAALIKKPNLKFEINSYDRMCNINHYDISISLLPPSPIGTMSTTELLMSMDIGLYCGKDYFNHYNKIESPHDIQSHARRLILMAQIIESESLRFHNLWNNSYDTVFIGQCKAIIHQLLLPPQQQLDHFIISGTQLFMSQYYIPENYTQILPDYTLGKLKLFLTYNKASKNPNIRSIVDQIIAHYQNDYNLGFI